MASQKLRKTPQRVFVPALVDCPLPEPGQRERCEEHVRLRGRKRRDSFVAVPVFDDEIDALEQIDVTQHVTAHRDDIGKFAFAD